jgi:FMN-dependent NADH-azoreductase
MYVTPSTSPNDVVAHPVFRMANRISPKVTPINVPFGRVPPIFSFAPSAAADAVLHPTVGIRAGRNGTKGNRMTKLLFIKASPRGAESKSNALAHAYLDVLKQRHLGLAIDVFDLAKDRIPDFDGNKVAAKMAILAGEGPSGAAKTAWSEITGIANRFLSDDRYLIATPMWNGGIPCRLKQYIDVIHQPGLLWSLDPKTGYFGLLKDKKAVLALTSGAYALTQPAPAFGIDHQSTYLKAWLNQAGVLDIKEIRFQPSLLTADPEDFKAAAARARELANQS